MRLFTAIPLPEETRMHLAALCRGLPRQRWVSPDNFHITLRFFGELEGNRAQDLDEALSEVRFTPFPLQLTGVGFFGKAERPKVLWAGVVKTPELAELKRKVDFAAQSVGVTVERQKYVPHVTLCRFKSSPEHNTFSNYLRQNNLFSHPPITVDRFTLFSSRLTPEGSLYRPEAEYPEHAFSLHAIHGI